MRTPGRRVIAVLAVVAAIALAVPATALTAPRTWQPEFVESFSTTAPLGTFPGSAYSARWTGYDGFGDTSGIGLYDPKNVLSVHNGYLDMYLHTSPDGRPLGAAPVPLVGGRWGGLGYARYTIRFQADLMPGYGAGWLLWPDDNNWAEGEIDFPEGDFGGTIHAYDHVLGAPWLNALAVDTGVKWTAWHTATLDWTPSGVTYYLDGKQIGFSQVSPLGPMHLVLQTATNGVRPAASTAGHVRIDSVSIYRWTG